MRSVIPWLAIGVVAAATTAVVALSGCSGTNGASSSALLSPAALTAAEAGVMVIKATVPGAAQVLADGQLLCQGASGIVAVIDKISGQPWLVTGKPAQAVAAACSAIGSAYTPVAPPTTPVTVAAVAAPL